MNLPEARSVWAKVNAAAVPAGPLRVEAADPNFLLLTVYRGAALNALTVVGSADNARSGFADVVFDFNPADTFYIQVVTLGTPTDRRGCGADTRERSLCHAS